MQIIQYSSLPTINQNVSEITANNQLWSLLNFQLSLNILFDFSITPKVQQAFQCQLNFLLIDALKNSEQWIRRVTDSRESFQVHDKYSQRWDANRIFDDFHEEFSVYFVASIFKKPIGTEETRRNFLRHRGDFWSIITRNQNHAQHRNHVGWKFQKVWSFARWWNLEKLICKMFWPNFFK